MLTDGGTLTVAHVRPAAWLPAAEPHSAVFCLGWDPCRFHLCFNERGREDCFEEGTRIGGKSNAVAVK